MIELKLFFEKLNKKINYLDENVKNPFIDKKEKSLNPFEKAFQRTYVWVDKEDKDGNKN